jgi:predicted nucleic acid-binding protein
MIVLDASVALPWFIEEQASDAADEVLERLLRGRERALVPELFYYEVFSVLGRKHPEFAAWVAKGLPLLMSVPVTRVPFGEATAMAMADLVGRGLQGYDAAYAALARQHDAVWLTFDQRASRVLGNPAWIVSPDHYLKQEG